MQTQSQTQAPEALKEPTGPNINDFDSISLGVASPEEILSWSHGEVKKPETINYRTQKPERDGLFCEKIFGPTKNWECYCGKYKRIRYKGVVCEKCGVEVTRSVVRRERMGHISLAVPVTHIWFLRSTPSRIGLLLDLPIKTIEQVVYFAAYIITHVDDATKEEAREQLLHEFKNYKKKVQTELKESGGSEADMAKRIEELTEQHNQAKDDLEKLFVSSVLTELEYRDMSMKFGHVFRAGTGAEAIRDIIKSLDLDKVTDELQEELKKASGQKQKKIIKRIKLAGSLLKAGIKPEWMIMTILPVIPPDLRPMVQLDGGRFAASDLNDLYRRVINRNNRLKKLMAIGAPEVICRNEKRMLQEAIDTLLNNSARSGRTVFNTGDKRKLRSLSDMLKGKQGRFRQNLLGKRVDYSGRSVIVVGPRLKLNQCGLPKTMALELFRPFVIGRLIRDGYAHNIKNAEKLISGNKKEVWDILEDVTKDRYVLLNRAPTLHRLGIQAFQPILVEGKAIQIHPLVCAAFNADFDGDQMAVHVPLSKQAQREAHELIASAKNLLKPSAGEPTVSPTQDMILGCYYLTKITPEGKGTGMVFADINEAITAYRLGYVHLQAPIKARIEVEEGQVEIIETTVGRLIFNTIIPNEVGYLNKAMDKKALGALITVLYDLCGEDVTARVSDEIKRIGFKFATKSGLTIAATDMIVPPEKEKIVEEASEVIKKINDQFWNGFVTDDERYLHTIQVWTNAKAVITEATIRALPETNDLHYMVNSGARGNWGQVTQLCGMKGLVANPAGKTIELPIKSNLKEGFTILEYFIATHGGRKGKSDTALKTAEAGYLTRRLVDAVQDIIIKEIDCNAEEAVPIKRADSEAFGSERFEKRLLGRILGANLVDKETGEVLGKKGEEVTKELIDEIDNRQIDEVPIRSIILCETENGVCRKCYGRDLGTNRRVTVGTAVGIIAAQSIGEPGTQLTMRTFHMGGVAEGSDITQGLTRVEELFEARAPKSPAVIAEIDGSIKINRKGIQTELVLTSDGPVEQEYAVEPGDEILVKEGDRVKAKGMLAKSRQMKNITRASENGKVIEVKEHKIVVRTVAPIERIYHVAFGKSLKVKNGSEVKKGQTMTSGHINLRDLLHLTDLQTVMRYIVSEVQAIYASQGQNINDKHVEIIARQMLSKGRIVDSGDSNFLPGEIVNILTVEHENKRLVDKNKRPILYERLLLGLTRVSLYTDSWLSAASFQETIRVLVEASTTRKIDNLQGLKENVIIGKLIPAGETYRKRHPEMVEE
ncbi:DNA-directed RNA polymerase subunit beta' [Candidatus Peregrinibacteria bacterium CG_4_9_14_0_2_um_filter_53_11]|nr:MAG: DNA-directed RNA polymerase subunit beta' [Candidatus Peregrinibacteria bacterium CG_4_9_14_0_2_um_filter_53_11]